MPAQHRKPHPWSRQNLLKRVEMTRSQSFAEYVAQRPKAEAEAIQAAELAYVEQLADSRTRAGAALRVYGEGQHAVRETDRPHGFIC